MTFDHDDLRNSCRYVSGHEKACIREVLAA